MFGCYMRGSVSFYPNNAKFRQKNPNNAKFRQKHIQIMPNSDKKIQINAKFRQKHIQIMPNSDKNTSK